MGLSPISPCSILVRRLQGKFNDSSCSIAMTTGDSFPRAADSIRVNAPELNRLRAGHDAMADGVSDNTWSIDEIIALLGDK